MFKFLPSLLLVFLLLQITIYETHGAPKKGGKGKPEEIIKRKLKGASAAQKNKIKMQAAKSMQPELVKALEELKGLKDAPPGLQAVTDAAKNGKLTKALANGMSGIFQQAPVQPGRPAQQLQTISTQILPHAPPDLKGPLQGLMNFLQSNLSGVNGVLGKTANGAPDLVGGTVRSVAGTLGAVSEATNGSLQSLSGLLGGLLAGTGVL